MNPVIIDAISDTHDKHNKIDNKMLGGNLLLHAGDFSFNGYKHEYERYINWLHKMKSRYDHVATICGNHEVEIETKYHEDFVAMCQSAGIHYLEDSGVELEGIKIWGSPVTPWFFDWAWNRSIRDDGLVYEPPRSYGSGRTKSVPHIKPHWDKIPLDTNILITHGPPYGILDELVFPDGTPKGQFVGCPHLLEKIKTLKELDIHIFGHIHCQHGQKHIDGVSYYNASICDEMYSPSNPVTRIEYIKGNG
jgi:Icc-related predicted phosphoesterase